MRSKQRVLNPCQVTKLPTPWLVVLLYSVAIIIDWTFAYFAESQPEVIINSWSVLFPLISFFYSAFCVISVIGLYLRVSWGFGFGYITIMLGAVIAAISYLLAFRQHPEIHELFIMILIFNLAVISYLLVYSLRHPLNMD